MRCSRWLLCVEDVGNAVSTKVGWNPVTRSGFRPMSREKMQSMILQLKKERTEHGDVNQWTHTDWEEAKAEGLDTMDIPVKDRYERDDPTRYDQRAVLFKKEMLRTEQLRGQARVPINHPRDDYDDKYMDVVNYFAARIVWEVEEQYRQRIGVDNAGEFYAKPSDDHSFYNKTYDESDDNRFLQAKYIAFAGAQLDFWKIHHQDIIRAAAALFRKKMWRVRDVAYCDDMCFVFVDNRHQPHAYRAVSAAKSKRFLNKHFGGVSQTRLRGS
ncbi:hypothetical protein DIPPA_11139 [Diplonema papillatum]|nr:hypothetical protein DIPPA_11139 [Diplonema papillatum]